MGCDRAASEETGDGSPEEPEKPPRCAAKARASVGSVSPTFSRLQLGRCAGSSRRRSCPPPRGRSRRAARRDEVHPSRVILEATPRIELVGTDADVIDPDDVGHLLETVDVSIDARKEMPDADRAAALGDRGVAFSPDGRYLYVGNFVDSDIDILRLEADKLTKVANFALPGHPASMRGSTP